MCLWGCFQVRLAFESADSEALCLPQHGRATSNPLKADSFWCLAKLIQCLRFKNKIKFKKKNWVENNYFSLPACLQTGTLVFCLQTWTYIINLYLFCLLEIYWNSWWVTTIPHSWDCCCSIHLVSICLWLYFFLLLYSWHTALYIFRLNYMIWTTAPLHSSHTLVK